MTIPWGAPHVAAAVKEIDAHFTGLGDGGTYPGHGEDPPGAGFAADFWTTSKAKHDEVFAWLRHNAVRLGVKSVISWRRIWSVERASEGIREYTRYDPPPNTASQDHKNHVHVSFNAHPPKEEDMPSAREIADELAGNKKFLDAVAAAVLNADLVPNVWGAADNENVRLKNALGEIGRDCNALRAKSGA